MGEFLLSALVGIIITITFLCCICDISWWHWKHTIGTFIAIATRMWNNLLPTVTFVATVDGFKKYLKTIVCHCSFPSSRLLVQTVASL